MSDLVVGSGHPHNTDYTHLQASVPSSPNSTNDRRERARNFISTILILPLALVIAFFLTQFVFQSYQVDGPSMQPTLQSNDRLIVIKAARTWARLTGHPYIPKRGDIVIFEENNLTPLSTAQPKDLVKRVIGLPGDRVVVRNGVLAIYNLQHPSGYLPDSTLPYGKAIAVTPGNLDVTVPSGQLFVCGDNRANSLDSRVFGTVPANAIIGKLILRIMPLNRAQRF